MKKLLFTLGLFIVLLGQFGSAFAQRSITDADRRRIEQELERQLATDNRSNLRVRLITADSYYISNRETGVRGQASIEGRGSNRNEIWYETVIDNRRNAITNTTWGYGRNQNPGGGYTIPGTSSGPLTNGRYEIQLVATKRLLVAGNNGQVIQRGSSNMRGQQWDIEDAGNGYYYVRSADTGDVMTFDGRGDNGSSVVLTNQRRNRDEQRWEIRPGPDNGYYFIAPNGKSMDSPSSARNDGGRMQLYDRNGEANQRFWLRRVGDIDNRYDDRNSGRYRDRDRYDDRNQGRGSSSGSFTWQGRVDDVVELEIQGNRVYPRVISGRPVSSARTNFNSSLPRREVNVNAQLLRGRGRVEVIEQPSSRNNYRAVIRVRDTQGGADDYEIEISWN